MIITKLTTTNFETPMKGGSRKVILASRPCTREPDSQGAMLGPADGGGWMKPKFYLFRPRESSASRCPVPYHHSLPPINSTPKPQTSDTCVATSPPIFIHQPNTTTTIHSSSSPSRLQTLLSFRIHNILIVRLARFVLLGGHAAVSGFSPIGHLLGHFLDQCRPVLFIAKR